MIIKLIIITINIKSTDMHIRYLGLPCSDQKAPMRNIILVKLEKAS